VAREVVEKELPPLWDYLERELGERDYFVGASLTLADIAVLTPHVSLRHAGVAPERKRWPRLRAFLDRMLGRPSVKKIVDEETPVFGKRSIKIQD
jgi:glutathione S-transferase